MCVSPITLRDGTRVACRGCWACQAERRDDLVGRCVAEAVTSDYVAAVTLTYAGDGAETAVLRYSDVQKFLKRLRFAGFQVRYICAGEYGSKKGRAHWHMVLFFRGARPEAPEGQRFDWVYWPHGVAYFQSPNWRGFNYVLKYALKDVAQAGATRALAMSKKPPLGFDYFVQLAERTASAGLPLQSPEYSFLDVCNRQGPKRFFLKGRMRDLYCEQYVRAFREVWRREPPMSDFLAEFLDKQVRAEIELSATAFDAEILARPRPRVRLEPDVHEGVETFRPVAHLLWQSAPPRSATLGRDGRVFIEDKEGQEWMLESEGDLLTQLSRLGFAPRIAEQVSQWVLHRLGGGGP